MSATTIRYRGKVINHDSMTNPENGYVEGFYYQDLDNGVVKHYIFNCPMTWEVDPETVRIIRHDDLPKYENPVTTTEDIKELQQRLVRTCIDFVRTRNLTDIDAVRFNVDGLEDSIAFCEWTPCMDSYIGVEGLQEETHIGKSGKSYKSHRVRKFIGEYM
jgi:hypothetical protein